VNALADLARSMLAAAIAAVQPPALIRKLSFDGGGVSHEAGELHPAGALVLVALGKAGPALAAEAMRRGERPPDEVFILAPDGVPTPERVVPFTRRASHPHPDARGVAATRELQALLAGLAPADGVLLLLSGGASALLAEPLAGLDPAEVAGVSSALLACGASIHELNTVRKHLLAATGGRLAAGCPAEILTLALSDVPGDDPATIASGVTVADPTTFADALDVVARHRLAPDFPAAAALLEAGRRGEIPESPKPGDRRLARSRYALLGTSRDALEAAAAMAAASGLRPLTLTRTLGGDAQSVGSMLAGLARAAASGEALALLAAGETTTRLRGPGRGGRNLELALSAACGLAGAPERCLLAAGTDGVDGSSPAAGAVVDGDTLIRAARRGRDAALALACSDSWGFFTGLPEAIVTGPTGTNVADLALVLIAGGKPIYLPAIVSQQADVPMLG
jgi:glycerate 2-kinase